MNIVVKSPVDCTQEELHAFLAMILSGNKIMKERLEQRIRNAVFLAFAYDDAELVGIAALKRPLLTYKNRIFQQAAVPEQAKKFLYEFGYAVTKKTYRRKGVATELAQSLLQKTNKNVFATTGNKIAEKLLERFGFKKLGTPYKGYNKNLFLYGR